MSIKKRYLKSRPVCKCTFELPKAAAEDVNTVYLVGEFNDWDPKATPMKRLKNGSFKAELELPHGQAFSFRYLRENGTWENDWEADEYRPVPGFGVDNSVVRV